MATRSWPIVSCLFKSNASLSFVPTPSVPDTKTGFLNFSGISNKEPKPPKPPIDSLRLVSLAKGLILLINCSPASISTPASL